MKYILILTIVLSSASIVSAIDIKPRGMNVVEYNRPTADSLLAEADSVFQSRDYKSALESYQTTATVAEKEFNNPIEVEALSQIARCYLLLGEKETGRPFLEMAGAKAHESDPLGWSRYLGVKGRFQWQDGDNRKAKATFEQMYTFCNVSALYGRAVDAAHMIAIVADTFDEQIEWGKRGIEAAEASGDEKWLGPLWNNMGGTYWDNKQFESALECYRKAREYHWRFSGEIAKLFADYHIGMTLRFLGRYDEARTWLRPVLAWAERLENHNAIGQACEDLGECEIGDGNKTEGLELLKRARDEYKRAGFDTSWQEVWDHINTRIAEVEG